MPEQVAWVTSLVMRQKLSKKNGPYQAFRRLGTPQCLNSAEGTHPQGGGIWVPWNARPGGHPQGRIGLALKFAWR